VKILNINSYYLSSTVHSEFEKALIERGHTLKTIVPIQNDYKVRDEVNAVVPEHVSIIECFNKIDRPFFGVKQKKIMQAINKFSFDEFDLLHAHSLFTNGYIAYKVYKKFKTPYVVTVRDTDLNIFFKRMVHLRGAGLEILKYASKVIFLSAPYREQLIKKYIPNELKGHLEKKSVIIPNGINKFWLDNANSAKTKDEKIIKLIFAGNIIKRKNLERVIKACDLIKLKGYKVEFQVVGKVLDKSVGRKLLNSDLVKLRGRVNKEELIKYYRESQIFVMPSITESFGLVYAEAMSQGMPVIYSKGQGFDGLFKEGEVGYSVDALNIDDIKDKILLVYDDYNKLSNKCIQNVDVFSWEKLVIHYENEYKGIMGVVNKELIS